MRTENLIRALTLILLLGFVSTLMACAPDKSNDSKGVHPGWSSTAPWITKLDVLKGPVVMESTPVNFNGQLLLVTWDHGSVNPSVQDLVVYDMATMTELSRISSGLGFINAMVDSGTLYVFGTLMGAGVQNGYEVRMLSTTDLSTWTPQTTLFGIRSDLGQSIYNSSVTKDATGYMMAYEVCQNGITCFNVMFKHSTDLVTWTDAGGIFSGPQNNGYYTGCPTIRFVNGYYYLFYLAEYEGGDTPVYATMIDRSTDLVTWTESAQAVIWPDGPDINRNTSDFDLVEFNGQVQMVYSKSYQEAGANHDGVGIHQAVFNGTLQQFVEKFFN